MRESKRARNVALACRSPDRKQLRSGCKGPPRSAVLEKESRRETMNRFAGTLLDRRVSEIDEDLALIDEWSGQYTHLARSFFSF